MRFGAPLIAEKLNLPEFYDAIVFASKLFEFESNNHILRHWGDARQYLSCYEVLVALNRERISNTYCQIRGSLVRAQPQERMQDIARTQFPSKDMEYCTISKEYLQKIANPIAYDSLPPIDMSYLDAAEKLLYHAA